MSIAEVVTTGLLLVFGLLILITGILYLLPHTLRLLGLGKKEVQRVVPQQANTESLPVQTSADETQIVAAIMAAISAHEESLGNPSGTFRVVSFKRIGGKRI